MSRSPLQQKSAPAYGALHSSVNDGGNAASSHGRVHASLFSRALFTYIDPIMRLANARQLRTEDLWPLEDTNSSASIYATFKTQLDRHGGSVVRAQLAVFGPTLLLCGLGALFSAACAVLAPLVLHHVIDAFTAPQIDLRALVVWLGAFFASRLLNVLVATHMGYHVSRVAMRTSAALRALIFRKALRRSVQSKSAVDISNLYSNDVNNLMWSSFMINNLWILPLQIGVVIYLLYATIGLAAFAGLAVIALTMVSSVAIASVAGNAFRDSMARLDARMKAVKEAFNAIQTVKFNAWEAQFEDKIHRARAFELQATAKYLYFNAASAVLLWTSPILVSTVSFAVYALVLKQPLTAAKVFTAIALFNAIRDPLNDLPSAIQHLVQIRISLDRLAHFLALDEYDPDSVLTRDDPSQPDDVIIAITDGSFGWSREDAPVLTDVNLAVKRGDLVVVHGAVGAGKSSLCSALLGEMHKLSGSVFVRGTAAVAYYSQQTWIQNRTIRDNIVFDSAFDARKYDTVLDACGLLPDLAQLPGGDATEIGQRGVNLSGGQKARICLARACYSDAELLVLDSPLAAVDAVVQSEIFSKCICDLLKHKTVVLVTHSPDLIASDAANLKVLVDNNTLTCERSERSWLRSSGLFAPQVALPRPAIAGETEESKAQLADAGRLVQDEERQAGRVSKHVFAEYFDSVGGAPVCLSLVAVQVLWQACQIGSDLWLSHWTGETPTQATNTASSTAETERNMALYALLCAGSTLMVLARTLTVTLAGLRGSRSLFDAMTRSLLHAPLRFFDTNPMGRIVNRYSDDVATVDLRLAELFDSFLSVFFFTLFQLATAVYTVSYFGIFILPLVYMYVATGNFYLAPSRDMSRLFRVAASPPLSHVDECEDGMTQLRAFGTQYVQRAIAANHERVDATSQVWSVLLVIRQWFRLRMELLGCGVVIVVVSALVYLREFVSPGLVGVAFSYALSVDARLASLIQSWSSLEVTMVSPERILEYVHIPAEGSAKSLVIEPAATWLAGDDASGGGAITFEDVVFRYHDGAPAVLKKLSFRIRSREKVGIVGRTGAGKSSLTMALFRTKELDGGRICIDGVDIASMPLHALRSRMAIIPQSPVLFEGPLRAYMDPFAAFSDAQIWAALAKVEMKQQIGALDGQLSYELRENGENFSVGERQLLCLARALLTQTRVVVLDEATAAIDHATERKLQAMIARELAHATVLTIAHRLATVLDTDRVLVLRDGEVAEFDAPRQLATDSSGVFYELAREGGYLDRLL